MLTRSLLPLVSQGPLSMVHMNTFSPTARLVTRVFGSLGSAMSPCPLIRVHVPKAGTMGVLPCRLVLVCGVQSS